MTQILLHSVMNYFACRINFGPSLAPFKSTHRPNNKGLSCDNNEAYLVGKNSRFVEALLKSTGLLRCYRKLRVG